MADVDVAIMFVLKQEDSSLSGKVSDDPRDRGGRTRYGVAEKVHPELTPRGFYDTLSATQALEIAKQVYNKYYATPLKIVDMVNQDVANAALSFGINQGVKTFVKCLQEALGLDVDGEIGPDTLGKVNAVNPYTLLRSLQVTELVYYKNIVANNPPQQIFFQGWCNRINENCLIN